MSELKRYVCQINETRKVMAETKAKDEEHAAKMFRAGVYQYYEAAQGQGVARQLGQIMEVKHDVVKDDNYYAEGTSDD